MDSTKYIQAKQANDEYQQRLGEAKAIRDNFPNLFSRLVEDPNHWLSTLDDELSER